MNFSLGFLMSSDKLEILQEKNRRLASTVILGAADTAVIGSRVTLIDCEDSQVHTFRLVETADVTDAEHWNLPVDSTLGLALLGSRVGDTIAFSFSGGDGGSIVLAVESNA